MSCRTIIIFSLLLLIILFMIDGEMQKSVMKPQEEDEKKKGIISNLKDKVLWNILFIIVEICILFAFNSSEQLVITFICFQIFVLLFLHKKTNEGTIILMVSFCFLLGLSFFLYLFKYILIGTFQVLVCLTIKG